VKYVDADQKYIHVKISEKPNLKCNWITEGHTLLEPFDDKQENIITYEDFNGNTTAIGRDAALK
jgi:hypothetical protein